MKSERLWRNALAGSCLLRGCDAYGRDGAVINGLPLASLRRQLPVHRTFACLLLFATCSSAQGLEGLWMGTLGTGDTRLRLVFSVERGDAGALTGTLLSIPRGTTNRIDSVTISGKDVRIQIGRIQATYEGVLGQDGREIEGAWIRRDRRTPLTLTRFEKSPQSLPSLGLEVDVFVPKAPTAVRADGRVRLAYEVHVTNWSDEEMTLLRLEALIGDQTAVIEGDTLKQLTVGHMTSLSPGVRTAVLVWLTNSEAFPSVIRHRLTMTQPSRPTPVSVECASTPVEQDVIRISPPVRGDGWWAGNGPDSSLFHRGELTALHGHITAPLRFAFDFARRVAGSDEFYRDDPQDNRNHPSYGEAVLAVGDGVVASTKDGLPDNVPYDIAPAVPVTRETVLGNYVVLDLGHNRYAVYAHLRPQSLRARSGEKVQRGQILGLIGNSGRSDAPHLHFHVVDGQDPLASEGIPFVLDSFSRDSVIHRDEMPLGGWVIDFKH